MHDIEMTTNPVEKAYFILLDIMEGVRDETEIEDAIGYLGEALDN